jgi:hypothetical protein
LFALFICGACVGVLCAVFDALLVLWPGGESRTDGVGFAADVIVTNGTDFDDGVTGGILECTVCVEDCGACFVWWAWVLCVTAGCPADATWRETFADKAR